MYLFLRSLRPETKRFITKVSVPVIAQYHIQPALDGLIGTDNLRSLTIHRCLSAKQFYAKAHNWLEAVGREKGDRHAALKLVRLDEHTFDHMVYYSPVPSREVERKRKTDEFFAALRKLM